MQFQVDLDRKTKKKSEIFGTPERPQQTVLEFRKQYRAKILTAFFSAVYKGQQRYAVSFGQL